MVGWLGGDGGWMGTAGDALLLLRRRLGCGVGGGDGRYCHGRSIILPVEQHLSERITGMNPPSK